MENTEQDTESEINRTLYLSGLPPETTEDLLRELFIQAGPLEKASIPQNKNSSAAFITFKHSVSVPYAKDLFADTQLYGRNFSINFRHGSIFDERKKQNSQTPYNANQTGNYHQPSSSRYSSQRPSADDRYSNHNSQPGRDGHYAANQPAENRYIQDPFTANTHIQGYRTSSSNREYVPGYVSMDNPPESFVGATPVNQPGHAIDLDMRRERLLHQQRYVHQNDYQRQPRQRYDNRRRY